MLYKNSLNMAYTPSTSLTHVLIIKPLKVLRFSNFVLN